MSSLLDQYKAEALAKREAERLRIENELAAYQARQGIGSTFSLSARQSSSLQVGERTNGFTEDFSVQPEPAKEPEPQINPDVIRRHVELVHALAAPLVGKGKLAVCCFGEDPEAMDTKTGKPGVRIPQRIAHFGIGETDSATAYIAKMTAEPHRNVYLALAVLKPGVGDGKKGGEGELVGVLAFVADFDDENASNWPERVPFPPNYVLETSPGRFQVFWLLREPASVADAKPITERLKAFTGCDHGTADVSHVWRIPGTLNWPNAKKVSEGRSTEPTQPRVVIPWSDSRTSLADLAAALPEIEAENEPEEAAEARTNTTDNDDDVVSVEFLMRALPKGLKLDIISPEPGGDRSKQLFAVIKKLDQRGLTAVLIEKIISAHPTGIGEKYSNRRDLRKEVDRILAKGPRQAGQAGTSAPKRRDYEGWRAALLRNPNGKPLGNIQNAITAIRGEFGAAIGFDVLRQRIVILQPIKILCTAGGEWLGHYDIDVAAWLQREEIGVATMTTGQAVCAAAHRNEFHPVRDYLAGLQWDGSVSRVDRFAIHYLGAEDTAYNRAVGRRMLIGLVRRIQQPGVKSDCMVVLEGPQGALKSSAIALLSPNPAWYMDGLPDMGTKDAALLLNGKWIIEIGELEGMTRAEVNKVKAYLSRRTDSFRPPYERSGVDHARSSGFIGTSNDDQYLKDETGGRRFWPVRCGKIRLDLIEQDRDQLWAEAKALCDAGEPHWLDQIGLVEAAEREQAARYVEDAWQSEIDDYIAGRTRVTVGEILKDCLFIAMREKWSQADQNRVARCLRVRKWKRKQSGGATERGKWFYYAPGSAPEPDDKEE